MTAFTIFNQEDEPETPKIPDEEEEDISDDAEVDNSEKEEV